MTHEIRNKRKIAISIDPDLLDRIDAAVEARGEARSAIIERMLWNEIEEEEKFLREMENPFYRAILQTMTSNSRVVEMIARVVGDHIDNEEAARVSRAVKEQASRGREREQSRKGTKGSLGLEGA